MNTTAIEYKTFLSKVGMCVQILRDEPLQEYLDAIEKQETLGPFFMVPQEYMRSVRNMPSHRAVIRAVMALVKSATEEEPDLLHDYECPHNPTVLSTKGVTGVPIPCEVRPRDCDDCIRLALAAAKTEGRREALEEAAALVVRYAVNLGGDRIPGQPGYIKPLHEDGFGDRDVVRATYAAAIRALAATPAPPEAGGGGEKP